MSLLDDARVSCGSETLPPLNTPKFCMYGSQHHNITKSRYITSNDPRGYIPVYEYPLNGQWIMMDSDDGYVLWTGIWKALGNTKADIVKMLDAQPELGPLLRRVRGGFLKIQGTWMPYEVALRLSRRVAWTIRADLVPLFGPTFPSTCLTPDQPGFGYLSPMGSISKRKSRRSHNPIPVVGIDSPARRTSPVLSQPTHFSAAPSSRYISASAPATSYVSLARTIQQNNERYSPYELPERFISLPYLGNKIVSGSDRPTLHLSPLQSQPTALPPISALDKYTPSEHSTDILHRLKHNTDALLHSPASASLPNWFGGIDSPLSSSCSTAPSLIISDSDSRHGSPALPRTPSSVPQPLALASATTQPLVLTDSLPLNRNWFS